jgi:hypothetical protein
VQRYNIVRAEDEGVSSTKRRELRQAGGERTIQRKARGLCHVASVLRTQDESYARAPRGEVSPHFSHYFWQIAPFDVHLLSVADESDRWNRRLVTKRGPALPPFV